MAAGDPVNGWDGAVLLAGESTFGTTPDPATAQSFEFIDCDMGQAEVGDVRAKKDRNVGRGMQSGFVEGRVKPIPFSIEASVKSRTAATTIPQEQALYLAAGLTQTIGGASVAYGMATNQSFSGLSMYRALGKPPFVYEAEQMRGGVVKSLNWSGGDKELTLKASGEAIGKYHLGYSSSVTMLIGAGTLVFANAEEGYRFAPGFYQCDSEIIKITAMNYTTFTATISRAQVSTVAAAHTGVAFVPYLPTLTYAGSPISEGQTVTVTIDGITFRALSFSVDLVSGVDMLPGESGSKYVQAPKFIRYDAKVAVKLVLSNSQVALLGKVKARNTCAVTIVQSTGTAGGIVTFSLPYCEVVPFKVPSPPNDVSIVDVALRVRDSAGNDAFVLTLT